MVCQLIIANEFRLVLNVKKLNHTVLCRFAKLLPESAGVDFALGENGLLGDRNRYQHIDSTDYSDD
jgi:hypothetical protein